MDRRLLLQHAAALGVATSAPAWANHGPKQKVNGSITGWRVDTFALTDQQRQVFTDEWLQAHWSFLLFGSTSHCTEVCTQALQALVAMRQRIARSNKLEATQLVFVSLDADGDTPERLRAYLAGFDAPFVGCSGTPAMLKRLREDLGVAADTRGSLWLIGPDLRVRGEFLPPFDAALLTSAYLKTRLRG